MPEMKLVNFIRIIRLITVFEAGVDKQQVMQRTGHSTTAGVRSYKRIGEKFRCVGSDVLNSAKMVKTEEAPNTDSSECKPKCSIVDENQFPVCELQCSNGGNKFPVVNLSGATKFTINFKLN